MPLSCVPSQTSRAPLLFCFIRMAASSTVAVFSAVAGGCPLMNAAIDCDDGNPLIRDLAAQGLRQWRNRIEKIAEDGIAAGEISSTADPRRIANVIISALEGALMLARMERTRTPLCDVRVTLSELVGLARRKQDEADDATSSRKKTGSTRTSDYLVCRGFVREMFLELQDQGAHHGRPREILWAVEGLCP